MRETERTFGLSVWQRIYLYYIVLVRICYPQAHEEDKEIRLSVLVKGTDCSTACRDIPQLIYCCIWLFTPILYASVNTKSF